METGSIKILLVAGARPNFMKVSPIIRQIERFPDDITYRLVHTGQHYDDRMSRVFFSDLDLPEPHHFLGASSGSHAEQTARIMTAFEKVCMRQKPDVVIVTGDVNSTLACALTAKKLSLPVAHVEAGLRSGDMSMPEEINRIVTDSISDYHFATEKSGTVNLLREGKDRDRIFLVGNTMIDSLLRCIEKAKTLGIEGPDDGDYAVVTLHRPSNVDDPLKLKDILSCIEEISCDRNVYFPVHPRTEKRLNSFRLKPLTDNPRIRLTPPLSYLDFLSLWRKAALVLTDSGGLQEETTALGVPCFTIRENTERPVTVEEGTNTLVGTSKEGILAAYDEFKRGERKTGRVPDLWDGRASERIIAVLSAIGGQHKADSPSLGPHRQISVRSVRSNVMASTFAGSSLLNSGA